MKVDIGEWTESLWTSFKHVGHRPIGQNPTEAYKGYADDCLVACSTQAEMNACFGLLKKQSKYIRFTEETPCNDWLLFIKVQACP